MEKKEVDNPVEELALDIKELEEMLAKSQRKNVKTLLSAWIDKCSEEKKKMEAIMETQQPKKLDPVDAALKKIDTMVYEPINKFAWDDDGPMVKVYVTSGIDGVGELPKGQVTCEFED